MGAVAMVAAMFTLPVAGTALNIADQHLHPRNLATALILIAVSRILEGKRWQALPLLLLALVLHPIMAALGMSFCVFLTLALMEPVPFRLRAAQGSLAAASAVPLGWLFAAHTVPVGGWRWPRAPTIPSTAGPGTSGWARWRRCFCSGCCGAWRTGAERRFWRDSRWPCLLMACSSRFMAMVIARVRCWDDLYLIKSVGVALGGVLAGDQRAACILTQRPCSLPASQHLGAAGARVEPIHGCRPLRGSGRIRRRMRISRSIRITWRRPARIITGFARSPSAANWRMR
jgi:hypothetical protein